MPVAARLWSIERAVQPVIAATIVCFVLASGSIQSWIPAARRLRWVGLVVLVALALVWAWRRRGPIAAPAVLVAAGAFVGLAALSVAWSAVPRDSIAHAGAFGLVLLAAAALARGASGSPGAASRVLDAVVVAAAVVVLGGLLVLLFEYDRAVQAATTSSPARYQGLGGGPNTATMLLAVALPPSAHVALAPGPTWRRAGGWLVALGLLASIVASGSRGALVAGGAGLVAWAALREPSARRAAVGAAAAAAVVAVCAFAATLPEPDRSGAVAPKVPPDPAPAAVQAVPPYVDANLFLRLQDDVGRPPPGLTIDDEGRTLTGSSGRTEAWAGALRQAADRPVLGYGFGSEESVFVDRYVGFNSNVPENSYVGLALELGLAGLVLFLGLVAALLLRAVRGRSGDAETRGLVAACAGALVAGLVLGLFQSYLYAAGNNSTAALWICAFLLLALPRDDGLERV